MREGEEESARKRGDLKGRPVLSLCRDPDTLEEQANLPGMRGVVENHIATAVGMATARMARAAAREMDGHVVQVCPSCPALSAPSRLHTWGCASTPSIDERGAHPRPPCLAPAVVGRRHRVASPAVQRRQGREQEVQGRRPAGHWSRLLSRPRLLAASGKVRERGRQCPSWPVAAGDDRGGAGGGSPGERGAATATSPGAQMVSGSSDVSAGVSCVHAPRTASSLTRKAPWPCLLLLSLSALPRRPQPEAPSHQGPTGSRSMRNAVMAARAAQAFRKQAIKQMQGTGESDADEEGSARSARQVTKAPSMLRKLGKMASMRRVSSIILPSPSWWHRDQVSRALPCHDTLRSPLLLRGANFRAFRGAQVHPEPDLSAQDRAKELIRQAQLGKRLTAKDMALLASEVHRKASRSRTGSESGQQGPAGSHASAPQDHAHARIRAPSRLRPSSAFLRPGEAMPPDAHQPHGQDEGHGHQPQLRHRASMPGGTQRAMPAPVLVAPLSVSPPAPARYAVPATAGGSAVPTGNTTGFTYRGTTAAGPAFVRAAGPSRFAGPPSDVGANGGGDSSPGRAAGLGVPPRAPSRQSSGGAGGTLEAAVRRSVVGEDMLSVPPPVPEGQEVRMDDIEALGPHRWGAGGRWSRHGPSQDGGGASAHGGPRGTSQTGSDRQSQVAASGRQGLSRAVSGVSGTSSPGVPPPEERVAEAMDSSALVKVVTTRDGAVKWLRRNPSLIPQSAVQAAAARAPSESGAASLPETVIINGKRYRRKRKPSAAATTAAAPAPPDSSTVDPGFPRAAVQTTAGDGPGRHGEAQQGAEHRAFMSEGGGRMGVAAGWESSSSGGRGASNEGAGAEPSVGIAKAWASADGSPDSHSGKQVGRALGDVSLRRLVLAGGVEEGEGGEAGRAREGEQEEGRSAMRAEEGQQEGGGEELGGEVEGEEEGADGVLDGPREGADEETEGETGRDAQGALEEEEEDGDEALVMPQVDGSDDEVLEVGTGATPVRLPSVKGRSRQGSVAPDAMSVAGSSKSRPGKGKGGGKKKGTGKGKKGKGRAAAEPEKEVRVPRTDASKKAGGAVYGLKGLGYKEKEEGSARGRGGAVSKGAGTGRGKRK